ncbi:putative armadillo-like helical, importin beta family [Helianthus anomalus]
MVWTPSRVGTGGEDVPYRSCIRHKGVDHKDSKSGNSGHRFVETVLTRLVSELLGTLLKQDQNDDICKLAVAGGTCLGLVARTVGDAVIPLVRPFVLENISKTDRRYRQAATRACGSYLEGVSVEYLDSDLPYLLTAMKEDQDRHVQATAQSCVMAVGIRSSVLAPHLTDILNSLVRTAEKTDASNPRLIATALETVKEVVRGSNPVESSHIITSLACCLLNKLVRLWHKQGDLITIQLLRVFEHGSSLLREKTMLAVGALACAIGPEFMKHMHLFNERLKTGLEDWNNHEVRFASYRVAGDLCRALDYKVLPFCEDIMSSLVRELCKGYIKNPNVKPVLFSCIGDMALAIGVHFEDYVCYVLPLMKEAADGSAESDGEYANGLKRSIFKAYSGILQGCNGSNAELMKPHVSHLLNFIQNAVKKPNRYEYKVCSASVEVASDICRALGYRVLPFCRDLVAVLFRNLCSRKLHRSAKALIYSCFGDIALAIGIYFEEHVPWVMRMMRDAADECAQRIDREYGKQLKRSVLKAYSAILQGCKRSKPEILEPHAPHILKFVEVLVTDANNRGEIIKEHLRLCGFISEKWLESEDEQLKETAPRIKAICG